MIISHSKKFIFVHIPKTGGISITSSFEPYNYHYTFINRIKSNLRIYPGVYVQSFKNEEFHVSRHLTASHIKNQLNKITGSDEIFEGYFKFSVVRNPYDILVSGYEYVKASGDPGHPGHADKNFVWMRNNFKTFQEYVMNFRLKHFPNFQHSYLYDASGDCLVDFIGKMENLDEDIRTLCEKLGVKKIELPHLNKSFRKPYETYFNEALINAVNDFYDKDFLFFGYKKIE